MSNVEDRLERIERKLDALLAAIRGNASAPAAARGARQGENGHGGAPPSSGGLEVASDADLDSPRGDPEVRFVPRRWTGADPKGRRFSECEPEFLDMLADAFEWFAQRDDESNAVDKNGNPKSRWSRLDASRARGWAARKRNGGSHDHAPPSRGRNSAPVMDRGGFNSMNDGMDEDIPF